VDDYLGDGYYNQANNCVEYRVSGRFSAFGIPGTGDIPEATNDYHYYGDRTND
jgi:hypothetical protein